GIAPDFPVSSRESRLTRRYRRWPALSAAVLPHERYRPSTHLSVEQPPFTQRFRYGVLEVGRSGSAFETADSSIQTGTAIMKRRRSMRRLTSILMATAVLFGGASIALAQTTTTVVAPASVPGPTYYTDYYKV